MNGVKIPGYMFDSNGFQHEISIREFYKRFNVIEENILLLDYGGNWACGAEIIKFPFERNAQQRDVDLIQSWKYAFLICAYAHQQTKSG